MSRARTRRRSNRNKNKVTFKWSKRLVIMIVVLVLMLATTIILSIPTTNEKLTDKFNGSMSGQTALTKENVYKEIGHKDLLNKIKKDEFIIVYYGDFDSTAFLENLEYINQAAKEHELKTVYCYDSYLVDDLLAEITESQTNEDLTDEEKDEIKKDNEQKIEDLEEELMNVELTNNPSFFVYKNNEIYVNGNLEFDSQAVLENEDNTANLSNFKAVVDRFLNILGNEIKD